MGFQVETRDDLRRQARVDITGRLSDGDATLPRSNLRVIAETLAGMVFGLYRFLGWIAKMTMPDTAEDRYADRWASIWLSGGRKDPSAAVGDVTVTGLEGSSVSIGDRLLTGGTDRIELEVTAGVTLGVSGTGTVSVVALTTGADGNLVAGTPLTFVSVPAGIDGGATVAEDMTGGADKESDEDLVDRYVERIQTPPHGGADFDYVAWAKSQAGVTRAWVYPHEMGTGTVTVRVMLDEVRADQDGIPTTEDCDAVKAYIDTVRPVACPDLFVTPPVAKTLDVEIADLANDTPELRAAIEAAVAAVIREKAEPGVDFSASWLGEAISGAAGEKSHTLNTGNLACATGEIAVPGAVTYV